MTRCFVVLATVLTVGAAHATTLIYKDFGALVQESGGIVSGVVSGAESYRDEDGEVWTFVTLERVQALAGRLSPAARNEMVLRLPGGRLERETIEVQGSPQLVPGDALILFLHPDERQFVPIIGWTQGVFRLIPDQSNRRLAVTDYEGNPVLGVQGDQLEKAVRVQPQTEIVDLRTGAVMSSPGQAGGGTTEFGQVVQPAEEAEARGLTEAMSAAQFISVIQGRAANKRGAATIETMAPEARRLRRLTGGRAAQPQTDAPSPDGAAGNSSAVETEPVPPRRLAEPPTPDQR